MLHIVCILAVRRSEVHYTDWLIDWLNSGKRCITNNRYWFWIWYREERRYSRYNVNIDVNNYLLQERRLIKSHLRSRTTLKFVWNSYCWRGGDLKDFGWTCRPYAALFESVLLLIESPGDSSWQQCCTYNQKFSIISRYSHLWRTFIRKTTRSR